jgi:hypothetical protein
MFFPCSAHKVSSGTCFDAGNETVEAMLSSARLAAIRGTEWVAGVPESRSASPKNSRCFAKFYPVGSR